MHAETRDRTGDLQIFSLTLSQLSYRGGWALTWCEPVGSLLANSELPQKSRLNALSHVQDLGFPSHLLS